MDRHFYHIRLALFSIFASVPMAFAGDLTIMDPLGMSRAAKSGVGQAIVLVETPNVGLSPILKNIDGLKGDISGRWDENLKVFKFEAVAPGTWQIQTSAEIQKVKILSAK